MEQFDPDAVRAAHPAASDERFHGATLNEQEAESGEFRAAEDAVLVALANLRAKVPGLEQTRREPIEVPGSEEEEISDAVVDKIVASLRVG